MVYATSFKTHLAYTSTYMYVAHVKSHIFNGQAETGKMLPTSTTYLSYTVCMLALGT